MGLDDIPRMIPNDEGKDCLNVEWARKRATVNMLDRQAAHAAASLPMSALKKGTETLEETSRKALQTRCTAEKKSEFCKGYAIAYDLMPCYKKNQAGQACGIEDRCCPCHNFNENTDYKDDTYQEVAKQIRHKIWNICCSIEASMGIHEFNR